MSELKQAIQTAIDRCFTWAHGETSLDMLIEAKQRAFDVVDALEAENARMREALARMDAQEYNGRK